MYVRYVCAMMPAFNWHIALYVNVNYICFCLMYQQHSPNLNLSQGRLIKITLTLTS